jgi:CBS domain-containing protein
MLPTVREHMDRVVHTVAPDMPIFEAVDFLLEHRVTGAPVTKDGRIVGMLSERDCLKLVVDRDDPNLEARTVADFMVSDVVSIPPDMDIYWVAGIFLRSTVRRLPVVENGKLIGAITRYDILRVIQARHRKQ